MVLNGPKPDARFRKDGRVPVNTKSAAKIEPARSSVTLTRDERCLGRLVTLDARYEHFRWQEPVNLNAGSVGA